MPCQTVVCLLQFISNSNVFYQYWWNPFEVNGNVSVGLIKSVGYHISTECMAFLQTILRPAFHVKKSEIIGLVKTSFWFTAVRQYSMEVGCLGCEFSARSSISKMGALADLSLCLLCETVRKLMFLTWTKLKCGDLVSVATAVVKFFIIQLLIRPRFHFFYKDASLLIIL